MSPASDKLLLGLLALALAFRLWGIADRLPDPTLGIDPMVANTAVDEGDRRAMHVAWEMWRGGTKPLDLNPRTGDWPGLPFYLTLGTQVLYRAYDSLTHGSMSPEEFERRASSDPSSMFLFARIFGALIGTLTVGLVYLIGKRMGGPSLGGVAALLLALNPVHILSSQRVSDPNLLALLFVLLATLELLRPARAPRLWLAGAMIGLAAACKYVPMVLIPLVALAGIERTESDPPESRREYRVHWGSMGAGVLAALAAFFIASPYTLLDWGTEAQSVALQRGRLLSEWVGLSEAPVSLPTYLVRTFPAMLGWPAYLLAIVGTVLLFRHRPRGWVVALVPLVLLAPTGSLALAQERFMVPAIGSLLIAAAFAAIRVSSWWPAPALLVAVSVAWPAPAFLRTREMLRRPDTRVLAHRWIEARIPRTEPLAVDVYGPEFDPARGGRLSLVWPFLATQTRLVRAAYHPEWLDGIRYYATSGEVERRFRAAAERYPEEAGFHEWIHARGVIVWKSDSTSGAGPAIEIRSLPDSISTRGERDSLWNQMIRSRLYAPRIARWCSELATLFLKRDRYDRAEEWASRGLTIQDDRARRELYETLSLAQVRLGRAEASEATARKGLEEFPGSQLLHVCRAMALESMSRKSEAIQEYGQALRRATSEDAARVLRAQIHRLQGGSDSLVP